MINIPSPTRRISPEIGHSVRSRCRQVRDFENAFLTTQSACASSVPSLPLSIFSLNINLQIKFEIIRPN